LRCDVRRYLSTANSHRFPRQVWKTDEPDVEPSPCSADASRSRAWARLYKGLARTTWTNFHHASKRLRCNARTHLSTPSSHCSPRTVWKTIGAVDKESPRPETPAPQRSNPLVHTKFPLLSTCGVENPRWPALVVAHLGGRGETVPTRVGIYQNRKQQGPPVAGLVVHVLQCGVPYSALPPNLWVYCRLIVRPTLSNQDTS